MQVEKARSRCQWASVLSSQQLSFAEEDFVCASPLGLCGGKRENHCGIEVFKTLEKHQNIFGVCAVVCPLG